MPSSARAGGRCRSSRAGAVVPEIELGRVAVQMLLAAVVVDAPHAALEDREKAFDRVRMGLTACPFVGAVVRLQLMPGEARTDRRV